MRILRLFILLLLIPVYFTHGQSNKPLRVELEPKSKSDDYYITPIGAKGVLVFNETQEKTKGGERQWSFTKYDTDFKEVWTKQASIGKKMVFNKFFYDEKNLYILLIDANYGKGIHTTVNGDFTILEVDLEKGNIKPILGKTPYNTTINDFKILSNIAYFGGSTMPTMGQMMSKMCLIYCTCFIPVCFGGMEFKLQPTLMEVNLTTGQSKPVPMNYKGTSVVNNIVVSEEAKSAHVLMTNNPDRHTSSMYIKDLNTAGEVVNTIKIDPKGKNELIDGSITFVQGGEKVVTGTFSTPIENQSFGAKMARAMAPTMSRSAEGVYITKLDKNNQQSFIKFHKFTEFKNFFSYLGPQLQKRVEKKKARKAKNNKDLDLNYSLLVHDVIEKNNQYIFVAEAYYPEYHYEYYTDANGRMQSRRVFDGWRYTHAIIAGFDKEGNLIWDNAFPIWNILTFDLKERVKVLDRGQDVVMIYSYAGSLESKIVKGNTISNYSKVKIETNFADDKVKSDSQSDVMHWYDDYFIAWGYQKIKNKEQKDVKNKRFVFYFNKVAYK